VPSRVARAEADLRVRERRGAAVAAAVAAAAAATAAAGGGGGGRQLFPGEEVDDLAAFEVGDAELLAFGYTEGKAMACLDDGAGDTGIG